MRSVCIALDYSIIYLEIMQALFCNFPIFFTFLLFYFFFPVTVSANEADHLSVIPFLFHRILSSLFGAEEMHLPASEHLQP